MFGYDMSEYDKFVYENELNDFLPEKIIDCHTHIWKDEFNTHSPVKGCVSWTRMVSKDCTAEDLVKTYEDMFPGKNVMPVLLGQPTADIEATNKYTEESAARYGFPALYCTTYDMSPEYIEKKVSEGGFAGLKPYLNNSPSYIPADEIRIYDFLPPEHLKLADRLGYVIMLHIPRPGRLRDKVNIAQLMEIEEKYPNIKLIVAHIGRAYSPEDIGDAFEILGKTNNMVFDFTANALEEAITACIEAVGPKRLLFGSDLPIVKMRAYRTSENGIYYNHVPRGLYGDVSHDIHMIETDEKNITSFLYEELLAFKRSALKLGLSREDIANIMCGNAKRIFNIK